MNGSIDERIVNLLKNQIKNNYFKSKEDLINDPMFKNFIESIKQNDEQGIRDVKMEILAYYDELFKTKEELSLDNVFDLENNAGNNFVEYVNDNNESLILENNLGNKDAKDLILDKQNELIAQGDNIITNDLGLIMDEIKEEKIEVELINDVKPELLNNEQQEQLAVIKQSDVLEDKQINFDPTNNLFVDAKTGESFTVNENNDGNYEIKSAVLTDDIKTGVEDKPVVEEVKQEEIKEINKYDQFTVADSKWTLDNAKDKSSDDEIIKMETAVLTDDIKTGVEDKPVVEEVKQEEIKEINKYDQFSIADLKWTLDNARDKFSNDEIIKMEAAYNTKTNEIDEKQMVIEQPKVLTLKKEYTGFSSLLVLCLTTGIGAISIFMYILLMIGV